MTTSFPVNKGSYQYSFEKQGTRLNFLESSRVLVAGALLSPIAFCHGLVMTPVYTVKKIWGEFELKSYQKEVLRKGLTEDLKKKISKQQRKNEKNSRCLMVAFIHLLPFAGIPLAAVYLKHQNPHTAFQGLAGSIEAYTHHFGKNLKNLILSLHIYPLRRLTKDTYKCPLGTADQFIDKYKNRVPFLERVNIPVNREDGKSHTLETVLFSQYPIEIHQPMMLLFTGNMALGYEAAEIAALYYNKGYSVLMVTLGGYPGSDEGHLTNEASTYQDVDAVIRFLKALGYSRLGIHGLSIGGTLALAAAELHPDVIKVVIADKTLSSIYKLASNFTNKSNDIQAAVHGLVKAVMPSGKVVPGVFIGDGAERRPYTTDGLDNVRKAKVLAKLEEEGKYRCKVVALGALDDQIMSYGNKTPLGYEYNCANDILTARYGHHQSALMHPGDHNSSQVFEKNLSVILYFLCKYLLITPQVSAATQ